MIKNIIFYLNLYFRLFKKLSFFNFLYFTYRNFLRKLYSYYDFILSSLFNTYSNSISNVNFNTFYSYKSKIKIKEIEFNFMNKFLKNKFRIFSNDFFDFSDIESKSKIQWIKKNINQSNISYSMCIHNFFFKKKKYSSLRWNIDYKKNIIWNPIKFSYFIKLSRDNVGDPKIPWEISRLQHLTQLSGYYLIDPKDDVKTVIKNHLFDFIISNPPKYGINWKSAMEVSIRGANIVFVLDLLSKKNFFSDEEILIILNFISDHVNFVINNLEWSLVSTSNHYLSNIVGLIVMTFFLPRSIRNNEILSFSINQLFNEIDKQFNSDGTSKEGSTGYHIFSNEMILIGLFFYNKLSYENFEYKQIDKIKSLFNKIEIIEKNTKKIENGCKRNLLEKVKKINFFTSNLLRNDLSLLQVGDNDSGCFIPFSLFSYNLEKKNLHNILNKKNNESCLFLNILPNNTKKFKSKLFKNKNEKILSEISSSLKREQKKMFFFDFKKSVDISKLELNFFKDFGIYNFKCSYFSLSVICRNNYNFFNSGHIHDDNLGIDLVINKKSIITDPGSFCYSEDPNKRKLYRSAEAHFIPRGKSYKAANFSQMNSFYIDSMKLAKCINIRQNQFIGKISNMQGDIYRKIDITQNGIQVFDFITKGKLDDYEIVKNNIKISSSFGVLSKKKAFNI